jgi:hypothetical protein
MATSLDSALRDHLARLLAWEDAHVTYDRAVADVPADLRGVRPTGLPHSAWELVEHLRMTQRDILEFCRDPEYTELDWPDDYWPPAPAPSDSHAWDESVRRYREDRRSCSGWPRTRRSISPRRFRTAPVRRISAS